MTLVPKYSGGAFFLKYKRTDCCASLEIDNRIMMSLGLHCY